MSSEIQKGLGRRIASLRDAHSLTQEDLASAVGVHTNTIKDIERLPNPNPRLKTLEAISEGFGITVSDLLGEGFAEAPIVAPLRLIASHAIKCKIPSFYSFSGEPVDIIVDVNLNGSRRIACPFLNDNGQCNETRFNRMNRPLKPQICIYINPKNPTHET